MVSEIETTWASKILFFILCATIVLTALAYGTVHQPTIAVFYIVAVVVVLLWAADAFSSGVLRFSKAFCSFRLSPSFYMAFFKLSRLGVSRKRAA